MTAQHTTYTAPAPFIILGDEMKKINIDKIADKIRDQFGKDSMKTIVNSFLIYMIEELKESGNVTDENINLVTTKFNNFLVVLKLVRDDENDCRQSLSNYHILQFQKTMKEFNIEL